MRHRLPKTETEFATNSEAFYILRQKKSMIRLADISTKPPDEFTEKRAKSLEKQYVNDIGDYHDRLAAQGKYSVLVIFQGMDASGKDGAVKEVFRKCSHNGIQSVSFKKPTDEEMEHDFLWRVHKLTPRKGNITIFNRSHYEDILIQRVHRWIDMDRVKKRMAAINAFEDLLAFDNNTIILKFYLHISQGEQQVQLQERIDEPTKRWKYNAGDWEEAKHWDAYREAYEYAINESKIGWHIIPTDKRWYRDYLISKIVAEELAKLDLTLPHEFDKNFPPKEA